MSIWYSHPHSHAPWARNATSHQTERQKPADETQAIREIGEISDPTWQSRLMSSRFPSAGGSGPIGEIAWSGRGFEAVGY